MMLLIGEKSYNQREDATMLITNRYELVSEIHKTKTTEIWSALDKKNGDDGVTIKKLNISNQDINLVKELYKREADSLTRIKHENIIGFRDSGVDRDFLYIVTEYFEAENLYIYIKNNPDLDYEKKLKIILDILLGLSEAHKNSVVHRDLKPTNILVDLFDKVKIIDFGISKIMDVTYKSTQTLKDMMTVAYASPEQIMRKNISYSSDFYSIGCLIYFIITGNDPTEDKELLLQECRKISNCSDGLKMLLQDLLQLSPDNRPESIYYIINEVRSEYIEIATKNTKLYLKLKGQIPGDLYSLGKLKQPTVEGAITFIAGDLEKSSLYKNNNNYYLIGESIKYHCKLSSDNGSLIVGSMNSLEDDYSLKEQELRRAIEIHAKWFVIKHNQPTKRSDALNQILMHINDEEKRRKVRNKRERDENNLLQKWDEYLQEENLIVQQKKKMCNYSDFVYDSISGRIIITIDDSNISLEKNDQIQLTSKVNSSQITIGTLDSIEANTLVAHIKPNVDLEEISQRGKVGLDLIQVESSFKRLRNATRAVMYGKSVNKNLIDIIRDPDIVTMNSVVKRREYKQPLDESNKAAVEKALATKDLFLIQGPPGTGKTTVITEIVLQILQDDPEAKILLTSQSHVAVDHALLNIAKYIGDKKAIRIGRNDKIAVESKSLLMTNQVNDWVSEVRRKSNANYYKFLKETFELSEEVVQEQILKIEDSNSILNVEPDDQVILSEKEKKLNRLTQITKAWNKRLGNMDEFDEIFAKNVSIIAATCLGIASRNVLNEMVFDWVIVDEAARATAPELLVPIVRGKKIILVGDHKQLPPVVNSNIEQYKKTELGIRKSDLEKSLFEELFEKIPDEAKSVLTAQFRMHPNIGRLINDVFYPSEKILSKKATEERKHLLNWWPKTVMWLNTGKIPNNFEQEVGLSKRNEVEAKLINKILIEMDKAYALNDNKATVAVISGYDAQRSILNNLIQPNDEGKWKGLKLVVNNVDAFQGSETDIAIYSLVRNNKEGKIGFLNDARRLNVALSRGKTCLILVGNINFAERARGLGVNPFVDVISYIRNYPDDCIVEDVKI